MTMQSAIPVDTYTHIHTHTHKNTHTRTHTTHTHTHTHTHTPPPTTTTTKTHKTHTQTPLTCVITPVASHTGVTVGDDSSPSGVTVRQARTGVGTVANQAVVPYRARLGLPSSCKNSNSLQSRTVRNHIHIPAITRR